MKSIIIFIITILLGSIYPLYNIGLKRSFIDSKIEVIPNKLISDSVVEIYKDDQEIKYIYKDNFEFNFKEYLNLTLKDIIKKYQISFTYFIKEDDKYFVDISEYPKNVEIKLKVYIYEVYERKYEKVFMVI